VPLKRTILLCAALFACGGCRQRADSKRIELHPLGSHQDIALAAAPSSQSQTARDVPRDDGNRAVVRIAGARRAALKNRFPNSEVQSAIEVQTRDGPQVFALVWKNPPKAEDRCPPESDWTAYDVQSCTGFAAALAGSAALLRFVGDVLADSFPLSQFFQHDANPSGIEKEGKRGPRNSFIPREYVLEPRDLNADGFSNEFLFHVGNGPYAMMAHWVAVGLLRDKLDAVRGGNDSPLIASREAWLDLATKGHGTSELYCGARCANTARRWTLDRAANGTITERQFWTCTPDDPKSWKLGEQTADCEH
jgi:hypothetical protein